MSNMSEIAASRIVIHDSAGRSRIVLGMGSDDEPSIRIFDRDGHERVLLGLLVEPADPAEDSPAPCVSANLALRGGPSGGEATIAALPESYAVVELQADPGRSAPKAFIEVTPDGAQALLTGEQ